MGLRMLACWDCGFECRRGHGCLSHVNVLCCQVEISATGREFVQMSPTECVFVSLSVFAKPQKCGGLDLLQLQSYEKKSKGSGVYVIKNTACLHCDYLNASSDCENKGCCKNHPEYVNSLCAENVLCLWFRASLIYINNCPTRRDTKQSIILQVHSTFFDVLLTAHLSKFILVINQLDAQNLFYNKFISCLYMFRAPCAHRQEVKNCIIQPVVSSHL